MPEPMESVEDEHSGQPERPPPRFARTRRLAEELEERGRLLNERAQAERSRHRSVDAVFEMVDRDFSVGGGLIAGALAYRCFILLLPLALVMVAGLGITADATGETPEEAARSAGLAGLVSNSVAAAASGSARWYALIVGIIGTLWAGRSLFRAVIVSHRLVWIDVRERAPKPKLLASLRFLGLLILFEALFPVASFIRHESPGLGLLAGLVMALPFAGIWLLIAIRLPRRDAPWTALVPGALLMGVGAQLLQAVTSYFIVPLALNKQGTYGALGIAAALLLGLFFFGRLIVDSAVVNATLWERRART
jgi:membrane protein